MPSRKEILGKKNELSEKQETSSERLDRTQKPRTEEEPEESCGNNNILLRAEFWAAPGGAEAMERMRDLHCSLEKEIIPFWGSSHTV